MATSLVAAMRAHLGHHERAIAFTFQRDPQPLFALAVVIIPGVIEEIDSSIQRARYNFV